MVAWQVESQRAPIEDVTATAYRAARPAPAQVQTTTVRYHDSQGAACADAIVKRVNQESGVSWRLEPLSSAFKGSKGVIEVWFSKHDEVARDLPAEPQK